MFGDKYCRLKFWIISVILFIIAIPILVAKDVFKGSGNVELILIISSIGILISAIWINTLANRIRDYGDNPWIALFSIIPFANIGLALFYGIVKSKNKESKQEEKVNSNEISLTKAVYNHTKDIVSEIKPTINEYKENHTTAKNENLVSINTNLEINEDEIYEKVMLEIEEDNKVKSTWARALSQSNGDDKKATSLYINLRVQEIKIELENIKRDKILEVKENRIKMLGGKELSKIEKDFLLKYNVNEFSQEVEITSDKIVIKILDNEKIYMRA